MNFDGANGQYKLPLTRSRPKCYATQYRTLAKNKTEEHRSYLGFVVVRAWIQFIPVKRKRIALF